MEIHCSGTQSEACTLEHIDSLDSVEHKSEPRDFLETALTICHCAEADKQDKDSSSHRLYVAKALHSNRTINACSKCNSFHIPLSHARFCPFQSIRASQRADLVSSSGTKPCSVLQLAVCVLLVDSQRRLLLTRRTKHMRAFPSAWVFPGGKVDPNETIIQTGAREVEEETGLKINHSTMKPLCLWESVYPTQLEYGAPKSHVLIVYFHAELDDVSFLPSPPSPRNNNNNNSDTAAGSSTSADITTATGQSAALRFSHNEVDMAVALELPVLNQIVSESEHEIVPLPDHLSVSAAASSSAPLFRTPSTNISTQDSSRENDGQSSAPIPNIIVEKCQSSSSENTAPLSSLSQSVEARVRGLRVSEEGNAADSVPLSDLCGVYPNAAGTGIAEGHLFAIRVLSNKLKS